MHNAEHKNIVNFAHESHDNVLQLVQIQLQPVDFFRQFFVGLQNQTQVRNVCRNNMNKAMNVIHCK